MTRYGFLRTGITLTGRGDGRCRTADCRQRRAAGDRRGIRSRPAQTGRRTATPHGAGDCARGSVFCPAGRSRNRDCACDRGRRARACRLAARRGDETACRRNHAESYQASHNLRFLITLSDPAISMGYSLQKLWPKRIQKPERRQRLDRSLPALPPAAQAAFWAPRDVAPASRSRGPRSTRPAGNPAHYWLGTALTGVAGFVVKTGCRRRDR